MKNFIKVFFAVVLLTAASAVSAQPDNLQNLISARAQQKVKQMTDYIARMADKERPLEERYDYRQLALNLFIGHGGKYEMNGAEREGVMVQITSKFRPKPRMRLMRDYFKGLINLRYSKVVILSTEMKEIKVSDLKKIDEHEYVCTCTFTQAFCGYKDGIAQYRDITEKRVTCYVKEEEVITTDADGCMNVEYEYILLLGDVEALETYD